MHWFLIVHYYNRPNLFHRRMSKRLPNYISVVFIFHFSRTLALISIFVSCTCVRLVDKTVFESTINTVTRGSAIADGPSQRHIALKVNKLNISSFFKYSPLQSTVTLKTGLGVIQGHWKWCHSTDRMTSVHIHILHVAHLFVCSVVCRQQATYVQSQCRLMTGVSNV